MKTSFDWIRSVFSFLSTKRYISSDKLTSSSLYKRGSQQIKDNDKKIFVVGLMRVRNEINVIDFSLRALAQHTDAIIVLDDCSSDGTFETIQSLEKECNIIRVIHNEEYIYDEWRDRTSLIDAARELGGTHLLMLDADEAITANFPRMNLLRKLICGLEPGDVIRLQMFNLWRGIDKYRRDRSVWSGNTFPIVFCDDGNSQTGKKFAHFPRLPINNGKVYVIQSYEFGILHFQFVNWRNLLIKQAWYRCLEKINLPDKPTEKINAQYAASKDETKLKTIASNPNWYNGYSFFNPVIFDLPETWREKQIGDWIQEYGKDFFKELDIWNIDWNFDV